MAKEPLGPFRPDCTTVIVKRPGEIHGVQLGIGCEDVAVFRALIGARPRGRAMHGDLEFEPPIPFFKNEGLSISFELPDGSPAPGDPEAWLIISYDEAA